MTTNSEILRKEHASLRRQVAALNRLAEAEAAAPAAALDALDQLRADIDSHLGHEDHLVYPRLVEGDDIAAQAIGLALISEFRFLTGDWQLYTRRWTGARIAADWAGFAAETKAMMARLRARIDREDALLYPLARRAAEAQAA